MSDTPNDARESQIPRKATSGTPASINQWLSPDNLLKLVQTFAILIAGAWALLQYLTYQREHQRVDNATASVTLKQSEMDAVVKGVQAEYAAEQAKVKQAQEELALKLAALNVTEKNIDLLIKQVQAQNAGKKEAIALQASQLDVARRSNEFALNDLNLRHAVSTNFTGEDALEVSKVQDIDGSTAEFDVTTGYSIKNNSENDLEVSAVAVQCSLAPIDTENQPPNRAGVIVIPLDLPPNLFMPARPILKWNLLYSAAYMYPFAGATTRDVLRQHALQARNGGAVTGVWRKNDGYTFHEFFIVRAPKHSVLGCMQYVITNDGAEQYDYSYYGRNRRLWAENSTGK